MSRGHVVATHLRALGFLVVALEILRRLRHHQRMWMRGRAARQASQFAELYAGALDRLGDPQSHQRMGALYTFESLGDAYPRHAQAIVDVICAYIRGHDEAERGLQQSALKLLIAHLRPGGGLWADADVDLAGAALPELDLSDCRVRGLRLDGAAIHGPARMQRLTVGGPLGLRQTQFHADVWLEHSSVSGPARFDEVRFHGDAWLGGLRFRDGVSFRGAIAHGEIGMAGTNFLGPARVSRAGEGWNIVGPGWGVVVDPDNDSVGRLLWLGATARAST